MSDRKPTTVLVRIIGGEEYDDCAPELLAEDVIPGFSDGVAWEIVPDEITTLRGAMKADDERLRNAGERVGIFADCDTAEMMADEITRLRAALADERKRALEEAADRIKEFAVAMGRIAEHRKANQQLAQAAIDTLEVAETLVRALKETTK